ncbi:MAG: nucleotidyltransferase family protein [Phycisphaeraceae bacterium]|nr:nucleotidyltransferase family protein [Phycisphaeraceae bacterium]
MPSRVPYNPEHLAAFCRKWKVKELALFGSVLRDDFRPDSDVDVLVTFQPEAGHFPSYWEWPQMMEELQAIFGRKIDLVPKGGLRNPFRRHEILTTREIVYAA